MTKEVNTEKRIISFAGRGYKDFVIYVALILNNIGSTVLINDISNNQEFRSMFECEAKEENKVFTYKNIDFEFGKRTLSGYDFTLVYMGGSIFDDEINESRLLIISSDLSKNMLENSIINAASKKKDTVLILRDTVNVGINRRFIRRNYQDNMSMILGIYDIPLDNVDKELQIKMDYDGTGKFKNLSKQYINVLQKVTILICGRPDGLVRKALNHAKEGRTFDNRILE